MQYDYMLAATHRLHNCGNATCLNATAQCNMASWLTRSLLAGTAFGGQSVAFSDKRSMAGCCRPPCEGLDVAALVQVSALSPRQHRTKNRETPENPQESFSAPSGENSPMLSTPPSTSKNVPSLRQFSLHVP